MCVSSRLEAAQHKAKGTPRGSGSVWRAAVGLAGHFGGLQRTLVHGGFGRAVGGRVGVGLNPLGLARVAAAAVALVGVRARAVALAGVRARAVSLVGGDAGAGGGAGADQPGHAGSRH